MEGDPVHTTSPGDPNEEQGQGSPILVISASSPDHLSCDKNIELGALGIVFPQPLPKNEDRSPVPSYSIDSVAAWVEFFSRSKKETHHTMSVAEPESVIGTAESMDEMTTPLVAAMTPMNPEVCSQKGTPEVENEEVVGLGGLECDQDLRFIGDEVVLKYILGGIEVLEDSKESLRLMERSKVDPGYDGAGLRADLNPAVALGSLGPTFEKALPELRHRKDPAYEEPPSITLIAATPNGTVRDGHPHFALPPNNNPPVILLAPDGNQNAFAYQKPGSCDTLASQHTVTNGDYRRESCDSALLDSRCNVTRRSSLSILLPVDPTVNPSSRPELAQTSDHPNKHKAGPTILNSFFRRIGGCISAIFRSRPVVVKEATPGETLDKGIIAWK